MLPHYTPIDTRDAHIATLEARIQQLERPLRKVTVFSFIFAVALSLCYLSYKLFDSNTGYLFI
jgi:hypothetical protein